MIVELFETERMYLVRRGVRILALTGSTKSKLGLDVTKIKDFLRILTCAVVSQVETAGRVTTQVELLRRYSYYAGIV